MKSKYILSNFTIFMTGTKSAAKIMNAAIIYFSNLSFVADQNSVAVRTPKIEALCTGVNMTISFYFAHSNETLTLKDVGGGAQNDPLVTDKACMPSIFIKTPQIFFDESCVISAFTKKFFEKLRMIEIGPRGR